MEQEQDAEGQAGAEAARLRMQTLELRDDTQERDAEEQTEADARRLRLAPLGRWSEAPGVSSATL